MKITAKTDRLMNCADSQALEVFIGAYLCWEAFERSLPVPAVAGVFVLLAALRGGLKVRQWACAIAFCAAAFLAPDHDAILVGAAAGWSWFRTLLDDKVS